MKIQAILGRAKKKYFWGLAQLPERYSVSEIISYYSKKFPSQQLLISVPRAIIYFDEAEESEDPISLKGETRKSVKKIIQQKVNDYLK